MVGHHGVHAHHHHHSGHGYNGGMMMFNAPPPDPNMVLNLPFTGTFATCGCAASCGCTPHVAKIAPQYAVTVEAAPFITLAELNDVVNKANSIVENNFIPPMPLLFLHFCIPFSPICIMGCYASALDSKLNELVAQLNTSVYQQRGCHWYESPVPITPPSHSTSH